MFIWPKLRIIYFLQVFIAIFWGLKGSKKSGKDQETIQSSTTPDPGYHMGK